MTVISISSNSSDYPYHTQLQVRMADLAGALHVGNHIFVAYITEAQLQLMRTLGFPKLMVGNVMPINTDIQISYFQESRYGDVLDIGVAIDSITDNAYQLLFHVSNHDSGKTICQARMSMTFINREIGKREKTPQEFIDSYNQLCNQ